MKKNPKDNGWAEVQRALMAVSRITPSKWREEFDNEGLEELTTQFAVMAQECSTVVTKLVRARHVPHPLVKDDSES